MNALDRMAGGPDDNAAQAGHLIAHALTSAGHDASEDGTGRGTPLVPTTEEDTWTPIRTCRTHSTSTRTTTPAGATSGVRRLTPRECERLQGFPDGWTDITWRGKPAPDSRRYAACGDAVTVPVAEWIGRRLREAA